MFYKLHKFVMENLQLLGNIWDLPVSKSSLENNNISSWIYCNKY